MAFAGMNYLAIFVAAAASFIFGGVWYGLLSRHWMEAARLSTEKVKSSGTIVPMTVAVLSSLVMAWILAGVIGHLGPGQVNVRNGVISALFIWVGFIATTISVNYQFQMQPRRLLAIDLGHWLGVLLIQGTIIGMFGV